jgi:AcrR family transcriptional regulator
MSSSRRLRCHCQGAARYGALRCAFLWSRQRPYHHGDLRRAIVGAALEILGETQSVEFSLRELARRAGVSHNAPYKHFADKRELLAAVSTAGFELLARRISNEVAGISNARARLFAMLRAYIHHGVENPALYRLMFGGYLTGPDSSRAAIERAAAEQTKTFLAEAIVGGGSGPGNSGYPTERTKDRRGYSSMLVPGPRTYVARGGRTRRPKQKIW